MIMDDMYIMRQFIDYGDLNPKAEEQIKEAFIDGAKEGMKLCGVEFDEEPVFEHEYEMFLESKPGDPITVDGWMPIATNMIKNPENIERYIANGLLRRI